MPRPVSYNGPAVRDPIKQSGSSPPGTETTLKEDMVQDIGTMRRRKSVVPRFRRLRVVRIYNIPANSRYISPRDDGDDKIRPSKGGKPAPSVAPASVAPPAQPLPPPPSLLLPPRPPSSRPATKQASTSSQTQAIATRTSSIVSSSATVQSYTTGADDAESSTSSSHSYSQQISVSSTSLVSDSTSTSDQYYEGGTSSSKLRALTTAISSSPTTLATSRSHMIPCSTMSITVVRPTNMVTLKPGALSPGRNAAIIGGTLGGIAALLGLIFLIFLFRRNRWFESLKRFTFSRRTQGLFKRKAPSGSISRQISAPLEPPSIPPMASTMTWNYEETFAKPSVPPPSRFSRIFRGPLSLHPPTPPPMLAKFPPPESLARTIFRNSNLSTHTVPSPTPPKRASVQTRSSLVLPDRYDRLPSFSLIEEGSVDSEGRRAMSYFSRASTAATTIRPRSPPPAGRRQSQAIMKSTDSEPARFRSVPSWVNHQSQRQTRMSQHVVDLDEDPVPRIPEANRYSVASTSTKTTSVKRKPVKSVVQSRRKTYGDKREGKGNVVFEQHPGTRVEVPGLQGKRIRSIVLDRNIWGWGLNR